MIEILVIEDDSAKIESIKHVIGSINEYLLQGLTVTTTIIEAKKALENRQFDIMILDLVIPMRTGEPGSAANCCTLLIELETSPYLQSPLYVVGLTQFTDIAPEYAVFFEDRLYHLLNYELSSTEWQNRLKKIVFHASKIKEDFLSPSQFRYNYDAAFITALYKPEFLAVWSLSTNWRRINHNDDPNVYYETEIIEQGKTKRIIATFADQMGMVASSSIAVKVMMKFRPKYLFMTGITAGIRKTGVNFGDILIADICWDYNSGKITEFVTKDVDDDQQVIELKFEPEPRSIPMKTSVKNKLLEFAHNENILNKIKSGWTTSTIDTPLSAFVGPLSSGSQVVASSQRLNEIKMQNRKLVGIEMEAYGLYYATTMLYDSKVTPIVIKSICDFGDAEKGDEFQSYAAYTSTQFAKEFLMAAL